jgi:alpha-L-fucosidase
VTVSSLGNTGPVAGCRIDRVEVVGIDTPLNFACDAAGLHVEVPEQAVHRFGVALRIAGAGLVDVQ